MQIKLQMPNKNSVQKGCFPSYAIRPIKEACMPISKSFEKMQKVDPRRYNFVQAGKRVGKNYVVP
jgi:hypothetical protein